MPASKRVLVLAAAALSLAGLPLVAQAQDKPAAEADNTFRVCADPNNLPFSNEAGEGFENKLAELIAGALHEKVAYVWHAQRRGFIRETLKAKHCDVIMGMPTQIDMLATTSPYYRSTYVFVSRADRHLDISSIKDPRLKTLKIGVQVIGDDGANTPPSHAFAQQGLVDNLVGFTVYGDYRTPNPPARIVKAVEDGSVDIAAVWGPLAGYFAKHSPVPLKVTPITDTEQFKPLIFRYDIALGVRKGDHALKAKLEDVLAQKRADIGALLRTYGFPTLPLPVQASQNDGPPQQTK
jgi:quinoprotein dehydrogenase-associated probable ABC transporter substrate-binding protein